MTLSHMISLLPQTKGSVPVCGTKSVAMLHNRKLLWWQAQMRNVIYTYIYGTPYVQIHYTEYSFYHEQLSQDVLTDASFLSDKAVTLWDMIKRTPYVCM
jgi:hypothetical protein